MELMQSDFNIKKLLNNLNCQGKVLSADKYGFLCQIGQNQEK